VQAPQNSLAKNQEFHRNLHLPHKESSLYLQKCKLFSVFFGGLQVCRPKCPVNLRLLNLFCSHILTGKLLFLFGMSPRTVDYGCNYYHCGFGGGQAAEAENRCG
jgi:hypothetical protein